MKKTVIILSVISALLVGFKLYQDKVNEMPNIEY